MTAATVDPAAAIAEAGQELLDALRELVSLGNRPELLDDVSRLLTRARRKVNRAKHAAEEPAALAKSTPAPAQPAPVVAPATTPPQSLPVTVPIPAATPQRPAAHAESPRTPGVPMSQPPVPGQPQPPAPHRRPIRSSPPRWLWISLIVVGVIFILIVAAQGGGDGGQNGDRPVTAEIMCEDFVKQRLKAPASAEFADPRTVSSPEGVYTVTGDVDSQNGFGAMIRNRYECQVSNDGSDEWTLVDLTFSGR